MKLKVLYDKNVKNIVLNELFSNFQITDNLVDADIVAVLYTRNLVKTVEKLLSQYSHYKILIEMTPHDFKNDRVFMINSKSRDLSIITLKNNVSGLEISHIDLVLVHYDMNLKAEVMNALTLIGELIGWYFYEQLKLRFSYNNYSVHVSGYVRERNFTLSIFISNTGINFNEIITIFTRHEGIFKLDNDNHDHSYGERYGAAIEKIVNEAMQNNRYYQYNIPLVIKSCASSISNKRPRDRVSSINIGNNGPCGIDYGRLLRDMKRPCR